MPGKALRLRHSQNNQPSALGAAYFGNTATLGQLHNNVYGLNNACLALPTPSCEKVKLSAAAQMWGESTWNPSSSISGIQT
jgi:hypothetical protein